MSNDKAIHSGKEKRKVYRKSKAFDSSCRNHGSCSYCESNRTIATKRLEQKLKDELKTE